VLLVERWLALHARQRWGHPPTEIRTLGFSGGSHVTLCCEPRLADCSGGGRALQGGVRVELTPKQGLLLWGHTVRGTTRSGIRIVSVVGYDDSGDAIARHVFREGPADQAGLLPVQRSRKSLGYGREAVPLKPSNLVEERIRFGSRS